MKQEHFTRRAYQLTARKVQHRAIIVMIVVMLSIIFGIAVTVTTLPARAADISCNCVLWVRSQTGLPGGPATAAGYTENVMRSDGYKRVNPQAGAIMVWDAYQKGAGWTGHMAITSSAYYNYQTKKWVIIVRHADWGGCGIRSTTFSSWGDLYGINFYVRR